MSDIILSIILPVYNAQETLNMCLQSLKEDLKQGEIELIAIDDGSTDNSWEQLQLFKTFYPNHATVLKQTNSGQGRARNNAIQRARGKYLGFVDADDQVSPGMFTIMLNTIIEKNTDMVICDFTKTFKNSQEEIVYFNKINSNILSPKKHKYLLFSCGNSAWNKIFKKDILLKHHLSFSESMIYEDLAMIPVLISKCNSIVRAPLALYFYSVHEDSTTHNSSKKIEDHLNALAIVHQKLSPDFYNEVLFLTLKELFFYTLPRYSSILKKNEFHQLFKVSLNFFLTHYSDWQTNSYIRSLPLLQRIYVKVVLNNIPFVVKLVSNYKSF